MTTQRPEESGDVAVLFPGQGTQRVGMGNWLFHELPEMGEVLDLLSADAGRDIAKLCARGPMEVLSDTRYTQPAVFAVGIAAFRYVSRAGVSVKAVAGHSVGEITALCASGALSTQQAAALVCERGRLMASAPGEGRMARITALDRATVQRCCEASEAAGQVVIAAQNGPDEHIVSGHADAVAMCCGTARDLGARRAELLNTSHAFHSPLMQPAVAGWREAVARQEIGAPSVPVVLNATAEVAAEPERLHWGMLQQLTSPVEWWSSLCALTRLGVRTAIACETGHYLSMLARTAGLRPASFADPRRIRELVPAGAA
jgi:[acyl-carrier-protein] S-malonyltransferase